MTRLTRSGHAASYSITSSAIDDKAEAKHNFEEAKRNLKNGNVDGALRDIDSLKRNGREIDQGRGELQSDRRAIQFDQLRNGMNKRRLENDLGL